MIFRVAEKSPERAQPYSVAGMEAHLLGDGGVLRLDLRGEKGWIPSCSKALDFKEISIEGTPAEFEMLIATIRDALRAESITDKWPDDAPGDQK